MELFFLLAAFLVFIVLQSIFINGVSLSMEGKETITFDGEIKAEGNILYPIRRFLSKSRKEVKPVSVYSLNKIKQIIQVKYGKIMPNINMIACGEVAAIEVTAENRNLALGYLESLKLNEGFKFGPVDDWMDIKKKEGVEYFVLYKEKIKYRYNSFLRKSIGTSCLRCAASAYGILTFVPTFVYIFGWRWEMIPTLVFDIHCLVFVNYFISKA